MALTKVIGSGVQGISNSSDATAMTIGSDEVVDFASNADFIDGRGIRLGAGNDFQLYHDGTDNHINVTGAQTLNIQTSGNNAIVVDANGHVTKPLQPAFLVQPTSTQSNFSVGSHEQVILSAEKFDNNADFGSNVFTAPVTGKYQFNANLYLVNIDSASDFYQLRLVSSNRSLSAVFDPDFGQDNVYFTMNFTALVDMDVNDTAYLDIRQGSGTAQTDIDNATTFSGYLVA